MELEMPFEQFMPRSFTPVSVRANAPSASGIYGISNAREWIFIGESDNVQDSLLRELQRSDSALLKRGPTGFVFELCDAAERRTRQDRLILEYEPVCNRRWLGEDIGATI
jgi:hypothetical protein